MGYASRPKTAIQGTIAQVLNGDEKVAEDAVTFVQTAVDGKAPVAKSGRETAALRAAVDSRLLNGDTRGEAVSNAIRARHALAARKPCTVHEP